MQLVTPPYLRFRSSWLVMIALVCVNLLLWGCGPRERRGQEPPCEGEDCIIDWECDPAYEECESNNVHVGPCELDRHCPDGRYCSDGACVSEQFVCTQLGCDARDGVCDPASRSCVNAETCYSANDCLRDFFCVAQKCETRADACKVCNPGEECSYVGSSMTIRCDDPLAGCMAGDASCTDGSTSRVCSPSTGEYQTISCGSRGCNAATGLCNRIPGDGCFAAIDASNGYTGSLQWSSFSNDYGLEPTSRCATGDALYNTFGTDVSFMVDLPAGRTVFATMRTPVNYGSLYIVSDCADIEGTCKPGAANLRQQGSEYVLTVSYKNESAAQQRLYIIADSGFGAEQGPANIEIGTGELICGPASARCNGDAREICSDSGMQWNADQNCPFGCNVSTSQCNAATNNDCSGALDIMSVGGRFTGTLSDFTATYDPGSACPGGMSRAPGRDALFFVNVNAGDRVRAIMDASFDAVVWAMTDCSQPGPSCVGGVDRGNPETLVFIAPSAGRYYIVADAWTTTATGNFTMTVSVEQPVCDTPGDILGCRDANTLEYCEDTGFSLTYRCSTTCTNSMCDVPRADICYDAVTLAPGQSFTGRFSDYTNQLNPGTSTCIVNSGDSQTGRDAVFAVQLQAGDILEANLTTTASTAGMYILDECTTVTDIPAACLYAAPRSNRLEFYAASTGVYYLVVDATSSSLTESFTVSINKRTGQCQPNTGSCSDGVLTLCNLDGSQSLGSITCAHGCTGTSCAGPPNPNNTCPTSQPITGSIRIQDDFSRFRDEYNLQADGCVGSRTPGKEAVYAVQLQANQALRARVTQGTTQTTHAAYIVKNCADLTNTCVAGNRATAGVAETGYVATANETVYLIVDSTSSTNSGVFVLDVDIRPTECQPSEQPVCESNDTLRRCLSYGIYERTTCFFGCETGACKAPENNTCAGAINATNGVNFTADIRHYSDNYTPGSSLSSCTGYAADGPDSIYYVDAQQGDRIQVNYTAPWDNSLWITTDCANAGPQCVAGVDGFGLTESLTYTATATRRYFIIADSFSSTPTGEFTVQITVTR
jgi:hypothetical protein